MKAYWALREGADSLALTDGPLVDRVQTALRMIARLRDKDVPLSLHRYWKKLPSERPVTPETALAAAMALLRLRERLSWWLQIEKPGVLV